ncbi:MAG: hypothetical protein MI923_24625 [Phycisphaerales bacterium]|nr:hypothetical protein [Phycisphaerales bacterium]
MKISGGSGSTRARDETGFLRSQSGSLVAAWRKMQEWLELVVRSIENAHHGQE